MQRGKCRNAPQLLVTNHVIITTNRHRCHDVTTKNPVINYIFYRSPERRPSLCQVSSCPTYQAG